MSSNGHLASIHSPRENSLVHSLCEESCWIGWTDATYEGIWTWSDGSDADFSAFGSGLPPWNPGEPNGQRYETTDAAYIYANSNEWVTAGKWDDERMAVSKPYVCKRALGAENAAEHCTLATSRLIPISSFVGGMLVAFCLRWLFLAIESQCIHLRASMKEEQAPLQAAANPQQELL